MPKDSVPVGGKSSEFNFFPTYDVLTRTELPECTQHSSFVSSTSKKFDRNLYIKPISKYPIWHHLNPLRCDHTGNTEQGSLNLSN